MKPKYVYVNTLGCQMNVYDSRQIVSELTAIGYEKTPFIENADLIVLNTCSVREKAEQKAFSFLGRLASLKKKKPALMIGVGGCVAQQEGKNILKRMPFVDIVFGTHAISRLARQVERIEKKRCRIVDIDVATDNDLDSIRFQEINTSDFVTIMQGCDNFCTYCVVPHVRGRETSRLPDQIVEEIENLTVIGLREVTLLGQNVNSYGQKEAFCSFPELLSKVNAIDNLWRIRFTTSHPKDLSQALIDAFRHLDKLCHHIHLPVQSGSNRVLKKMNRNYTREIYQEKVAALRDACPDIAITSDMIVGFPGETQSDFQDTLDLIRAIEFDGLFAFAYSDRPGVPASRFREKINTAEKKERLQTLLNLQEQVTKKQNQALIGATELVLVEGISKKQESTDTSDGDEHQQWTGRTSTNKIVNFTWNQSAASPAHMAVGTLLTIKIEKAFSHSLLGKPLEIQTSPFGKKGENYYAA